MRNKRKCNEETKTERKKERRNLPCCDELIQNCKRKQEFNIEPINK
jgi:hypothetical protein